MGANFAGFRDILPYGESVHLRISLAVEINGGDPFLSSEEVEWTSDSNSWRYQVPLTWPKTAQRLVVLVEELSTGIAGAAIVTVPRVH